MIKILYPDSRVHFYECLDDVPDDALDLPVLYSADDVASMMRFRGTDSIPCATARGMHSIIGCCGVPGVIQEEGE